MPPRRGLGRGLDALIGRPPGPAGASTDATGSSAPLPGSNGSAPHAPSVPGVASATGAGPAPAPSGAPLLVEIGRIEPNPRQPRRRMAEQPLEELAASIREHGVIQPLVVTQIQDTASRGPRYQLIAGERRWQAAKRAGLLRVPVVVREAAGRGLLELALVENIQRQDLNPLEEATAYQQLAEQFGLTQEQIGERVGKSRVAIANTLRLLHLPAALQQAVLDGDLSEGHARAILGLSDREQQRRVASQVIERGLSVRQTEELVRHEEAAAPTAPKRGRPVDRGAAELEDRFRSALGTRVSVSRGKRGGKLVIYYFDDEQLQSIYDRLASEE